MKSIAEQFLNPEGIITDEELIAFARSKPDDRDPEVMDMFKRWSEQLIIQEGCVDNLQLLIVGIKIALMRYEVYLSTKEELFEELNPIREALGSCGANEALDKLNRIMDNIESD